MIKIVFTNREIIGSKLIRLFSREDKEDIDKIPSHIAWLFWDKFVLESTFPGGMKINYKKTFLRKNKMVACYSYTRNVDRYQVARKVRKILDKYHDAEYDTLGVLFQGFHIVLSKLKLGLSKKTNNKWESSEKFSCQEIFKDEFEVDVTMSSPYDLMKIIDNNNNWVYSPLV